MKRTSLKQLIDASETSKSRWQLTPSHEVEYLLEGETEEVVLRGSLIAAEPDALVVSLSATSKNHRIVAETVKLSGEWKTDDENCLLFEVKQSCGKTDIFRFSGAWKLNNQNEILYTYEQKTSRGKRRTSTQELLFKGHWDLSEDYQLTYLMGIDTNSAFRFRGTFQTESILAKKGEIRYQLGVEVAGKKKIQTIVLFGKWKFSKDFAVSFEMGCGDRTCEISFGAEYNLEGDRQIAVFLTSRDGHSLGIQVIFTREFFDGNAEAFLSFRRSLEESSLEAGVRLRW